MKLPKTIVLFLCVMGAFACSGPGPKEVLPPCPDGYFQYMDELCSGPRESDGGYHGSCTEKGDKKCYRLCESSGDCGDDFNGPNCSRLGLFNGGDWNCNESVKVCRQKQADDCNL